MSHALTANATWSTITAAIYRRQAVSVVNKRMKAENVWVLSNPAHDLPNHKGDEFTEDMITAVRAMTARYKSEHYDRNTAFEAQTPVYWVARDGRALAYVTDGGQVIVRDDMTKREADAYARIKDELDRAATVKFDH